MAATLASRVVLRKAEVDGPLGETFMGQYLYEA